ncbi:hypothetical protein DPMN_111062 [Dreissena polymorpha]|uniref:DDE-1 domain-containing protein n=1 Tax=Dreissena polymorpha TaxID=45954 RepID=A0A9D4QNG8_DREPO|nr:hypothetical protein DPMN_111062 [Dreissena polymorpha]
MTVEKLRPLVIGKSLKPRCFKSLDPAKLPVCYYANKKAWTTSKFMEDWLHHMDNLMKRKETYPTLSRQCTLPSKHPTDQHKASVLPTQHNLLMSTHGPGHYPNCQTQVQKETTATRFS